MAETLDLVCEEAIEKTRKQRSGVRSRSGVRRVTQGRREGADDGAMEASDGVQGEAGDQPEPSEQIPSFGPDADPAGGTEAAQGIVSMAEPSEPKDVESVSWPTMDPGAEDLPRTPEPPAAARSTPPLSDHPDAAEFLSLYRIKGGALLHWRRESIDAWGAPILGAACKALLENEDGKLLIFDFSNVRNLSTQALATLIRFQNAVACLKQRLVLVAGDNLRDLLKKSRVAGLFEIRSEIHSLILPEMTVETRPAAAGEIARSRNLNSHLCREFFSLLRRVLI